MVVATVFAPQAEPAYSAMAPPAPVKTSAEVMPFRYPESGVSTEPTSNVKSASVTSEKSIESSSIVSSAMISPSIAPEPLSHLFAPTQKELRTDNRVEEAFEKYDVLEAWRPVVNLTVVEVAAPVIPYPISWRYEKSYPSMPPASVPHERTPAAEAFTSQLAVLSAETVRFVVEAVPVTAKLVVVAPFWPMENTVEEALVTASNKLPVPHAVTFAYGEVVPKPE